MITIVTDVHLKEGAESTWDRIMRERMAGAKRRPGWVGGQLVRPNDDPNRRVIIGTWQSHGDWQAWHRDPRFQETRAQLDQLVSGLEEHSWYDVVLEIRKATPAGAGTKAGRALKAPAGAKARRSTSRSRRRPSKRRAVR